ncbi:MAG: hypothetical protein H5T41_02640 [Methanomassiliicoccales archaeon]|nr:hypothetical protein [Methanomassiliicoccales archaeon]
MLVTFGYTGYRNTKFGSIEVHERITSVAREILIRVKEIAESMDLEVLHGNCGLSLDQGRMHRRIQRKGGT